jgi:homoserine O-acetyltransferase
MADDRAHPLGVVPIHHFTSEEPLELKGGDVLPSFTLEYETLGNLSPDRDNAILVCHALSGDAHVAGLSAKNGSPGWWETLVGPGKGIDTDRWFVACSNVIGGCQGSTGPSSPHPGTGRPWGADFPLVTIADMVEAQKRLADHLGVKKWHAVIGGSMGGMQVLQWMVSYPARLRNAVVIATCARHTPQQIAFNEVGRRAIISDPNWKGGHYEPDAGPALGLAVARMIGHITYLSEASMFLKFGRRLRHSPQEKFEPAFEVETYLSHQGSAFVDRFDANSYLFITKAIDTFDLLAEGRPLEEALSRYRGRTLIVSFSSDWLYPSSQSKEIATALRRSRGDVTYCEIDVDFGHDSFLIENPQQSTLVSGFLESPEASKDNGATWIQ